MAGKTSKKSAKAAAKRGVAKPALLAGGNPQIAKADGDAPVQAYIAAMPSWKRDVGRRLDALIVRTVPGVRKAVKWNSPFYGVEGQGWFLSFHCFTKWGNLLCMGLILHFFSTPPVGPHDAFTHARPEGLVLLLDTYDTEAAARKVVALAPNLKAAGITISGVRLDSGDLIASAVHAAATIRHRW
jgi:Domain of unknown function (DU1801)